MNARETNIIPAFRNIKCIASMQNNLLGVIHGVLCS